MATKKAVLVFITVIFIFSSCSIFSKKELETSFLLKVSSSEFLLSLSGNRKDKNFLEALAVANEMQLVSNEDFVTLFGRAFHEIDPNASLAAIFMNSWYMRETINYSSTNEEVLLALNRQFDDAFGRSISILRTRIKRFGISYQNVERVGDTEHILIELPADKNIERIKYLIEARAKFSFWETYKFSEVHNFFQTANQHLADLLRAEQAMEQISDSDTDKQEVSSQETDPEAIDSEADITETSIIDQVTETLITGEGIPTIEELRRNNPLFAYLQPNYVSTQSGIVPQQSATVGYAEIKDTAMVNNFLNRVKDIFPRDLKLAWTVKPYRNMPNVLELVALKVTTRDGSAALDGDVIVDARQNFDRNNRVVVDMSMNSEGARIWRRLTGDNIGNQIAIVFDGYVYSAPNVNDEIPSGRCQLSGNFEVAEAQDLANLIRTGSLPLSVRIVEVKIGSE